MYLISEFSKMVKVSKRMLRYYEKIDLFTPSEVDQRTSYRYYSDADILKLEKILFLRDLGFSFPEIKELISYSENKLTTEIIEKKESLKREIKDKENEIIKIDIYIENMKAVKNDTNANDMNHFFKIKKLTPVLVISYKDKVKSYKDENELWDKLNEYIEKNSIKTNSKNHFSIYEMNNNEIEVCIELAHKRNLNQISAIDNIQIKQLESDNMIVCKNVYGDLENIETTYCEFINWLQINKNYTMTGKSRHVYKLGPQNEKNKNNYVIELQFEILLDVNIVS